MIWGLVDILVIVFLVQLLWKGLKHLKHRFIPMVVALLISFPILAATVSAEAGLPETSEACPFGDAVLTNERTGETVHVDCIDYDHSKTSWVTWTESMSTGDKKYQWFDVDEWRADVLDGELIIVDDKAQVKINYKELSQMELEEEISKIFKGVNYVHH